jgi:hypothetical protein
MEASGNFPYNKFNLVNCGQGKVFMNPKQDPFLKHLTKFLSAVFKSPCICINTWTFGNFPVIAAVIRQDFIFRVMKGCGKIFRYYVTTSLGPTKDYFCHRHTQTNAG